MTFDNTTVTANIGPPLLICFLIYPVSVVLIYLYPQNAKATKNPKPPRNCPFQTVLYLSPYPTLSLSLSLSANVKLTVFSLTAQKKSQPHLHSNKIQFYFNSSPPKCHVTLVSFTRV